VQTFPGKIGFPNDASGDIAATITVAESTLKIETGDTTIGEWPIADVAVELGHRGYLIELDGEVLVLAHTTFSASTQPSTQPMKPQRLPQHDEAPAGLTRTRRLRKNPASAAGPHRNGLARTGAKGLNR
jgi:hypothetical protein